MKANRKFVSNDDDAVSPVIAVILMVAITVVLAATVYVWVSGFSGQNSAAAGSLSVSQVAALGSAPTSVKFTVTSVSPGFAASNIKILDATAGTAYTFSASAGNGNFQTLDDGATASPLASGAILGAGDVFRLQFAASGMAAGSSLQFIDTNSNNVIATIIVR